MWDSEEEGKKGMFMPMFVWCVVARHLMSYMATSCWWQLCSHGGGEWASVNLRIKTITYSGIHFHKVICSNGNHWETGVLTRSQGGGKWASVRKFIQESEFNTCPTEVGQHSNSWWVRDGVVEGLKFTRLILWRVRLCQVFTCVMRKMLVVWI